MSGYRVISNPSRVFEFVRQYVPLHAYSGMKGIGNEFNGELVGGVLYEGFTGKNIWMHVAGKPGTRWLTRDFLREVFSYPFLQAGCDRVTGYVEASNLAARRFDEHLGFKQEAVLKGAAHDGGDVILYVMWKEDCRYVHPQ